ncbi:MAG: hypothetical protein JWP95_2120 [Actinotalea sp.]|jgi:sporulation protein YlmC with PRC-barrel domain|nr:hypothetical protein [Actinotalea sp.]
MITTEAIQHLMYGRGHVVADDGKRIGTVEQVFLDAATGRPAWVTVRTGLFGTAESFVPLEGASTEGDDIRVPFHKDLVKDAPRIDSSDGRLTPRDEQELYRHYAVATDDVGAGGTPGAGTATGVGDGIHGADATVGRGADAPAGAGGAVTDRPEGMTLSRERARVVGTERVPTERIRLVRYTVTEERQVEVPVQREEYRLEYDSIDPVPDPVGHDTTDPRPDQSGSTTGGRA